MHVLGIDVGGTKTVCLLADRDARIVATARGEGANPQAAGQKALEAVLKALIDEVLAGRGIIPAAICLGVAGVDRAEDAAAVRSIIARLGYQARVLVVNDALIALEAGLGDAAGIAIVAGTGSIAYGRNAAGLAARAGGWGHVLGDEGSGYWIGRRALRAVVRHADGRGPATTLTPRLLSHFQVHREEDLIRKVYREHLKPSAIAALARHVQSARDGGDEVAIAILARAADELAAAATAVTMRLGLAGEAFTFLAAGGIFQAVPWLRERLTQVLPTVAPRSTTRHLETEAAQGAVRLALAETRGGAKVPVYRRDSA